MNASTIRRRPFSCLMLVICLASAAVPAPLAAQRPPEPPDPASDKLDLYGDPLPQSAVARLGTLQPADKNQPARGHRQTVYLAVFSPDGKLLASRDGDQTIRLWDLASGRTRFVLPGHENIIRSLAFSPDSKLLASASKIGSVRLWDVGTGRQVRKIDGGGRIARFSAGGKMLTVVHGEGEYSRYDVATGQRTSVAQSQGMKVPLALSPDGQYVAATDKLADKIIRYAKIFRPTKAEADVAPRPFKGAREYPTTACFSPDGTTLAAGGRDNLIHLWDVVTGRLTYQLAAHEAKILQIAFSPDRRMIATASQDDTVRLWETVSGKEIVTLDAHAEQARQKGLQGNVCTVAFSPDGRRLVSGSADRTLLVWDVAAATSRDAADPKSIDKAALARLWDDLAAEDAKTGYRAIGSLVGVGARLAPLAAERLSGVLVRSQNEQVLKLIEELGSDEFVTREKATLALIKIRGTADALLRKVLLETDSAEIKYRIERILQTPPPPVKVSPEDRRRMVRLVQALERSADPAGIKLLGTISKGYPAPKIQGEALRALGRLGKDAG